VSLPFPIRLFFLLCFGTSALAIEVGEAAPRIEAARLDPTNAPFSAESLRGQVVYVDFWASWCVPCRISMPALDSLYRKHAARGLMVLGVNKDAERGEARRFLARVPVGFPLLADEGDRIARAFAVKAMPSGYLLDRRGVVRHIHRGFTQETAASLEREIEALLAEKP
jgi:thiol-disulfide isomerase/thioredoxin